MRFSEYAYAGSTLLATIDQPLVNGTATGTPTTRYIHPDILGSTAVTSDAATNLAQQLDYYPYGATRINTNTGLSSAARGTVGNSASQSPWCSIGS